MGYCEERHLVKMRGLPFRVTEHEIAEVNSLRRILEVTELSLFDFCSGSAPWPTVRR